jgi:hypothetical protein
LSPEARVRKDHPLRAIRTMVDEVLRALSPQFDRMYASEGRPSIAPEKLLRAQLLQMLYSITSAELRGYHVFDRQTGQKIGFLRSSLYLSRYCLRALGTSSKPFSQFASISGNSSETGGNRTDLQLQLALSDPFKLAVGKRFEYELLVTNRSGHPVMVPRSPDPLASS